MGIYEQILEIETEEAEERGRLASKIEIIKGLLVESDWDIQKIAHIAKVDVDFVIQIKNELYA